MKFIFYINRFPIAITISIPINARWEEYIPVVWYWVFRILHMVPQTVIGAKIWKNIAK